MPKDPRRRFNWAKRQLTAVDGDQGWFWSRRSLLWALHFIKAREFLAVHMYCGEMAAKEAPHLPPALRRGCPRLPRRAEPGGA